MCHNLFTYYYDLWKKNYNFPHFSNEHMKVLISYFTSEYRIRLCRKMTSVSASMTEQAQIYREYGKQCARGTQEKYRQKLIRIGVDESILKAKKKEVKFTR